MVNDDQQYFKASAYLCMGFYFITKFSHLRMILKTRKTNLLKLNMLYRNIYAANFQKRKQHFLATKFRILFVSTFVCFIFVQKNFSILFKVSHFLLNHVASKAIDCLLDSPWASGMEKGPDLLFTSRESVVRFLDT